MDKIREEFEKQGIAWEVTSIGIQNLAFDQFTAGNKSRDKEIKKLREALEDMYKNVFHGEAYCQTNGLPRRVEVMIKAKEALKEIK